ncbi:hypothetical protein IV01_22415 [Pseudomonas syringae]|uniref:Uncharacterized protein n=1 Tax=Pseudomonas syringae TaxID=317 RepID=A0A085VA40_PSESX|nr:hypothetical protein IV01_22415 [Pseudomonas syringae]
MPANELLRFIRQTALSFFAGKPGSNRSNAISLWERCLPAIQAPRFIRQTALSFLAGKPGSNRFGDFVGARPARE